MLHALSLCIPTLYRQALEHDHTFGVQWSRANRDPDFLKNKFSRSLKLSYRQRNWNKKNWATLQKFNSWLMKLIKTTILHYWAVLHNISWVMLRLCWCNWICAPYQVTFAGFLLNPRAFFSRDFFLRLYKKPEEK